MQDAGQQNLQMHQEMAAEAQMPQCCGLESPVESGRVLARGTRRFPPFPSQDNHSSSWAILGDTSLGALRHPQPLLWVSRTPLPCTEIQDFSWAVSSNVSVSGGKTRVQGQGWRFNSWCPHCSVLSLCQWKWVDPSPTFLLLWKTHSQSVWTQFREPDS